MNRAARGRVGAAAAVVLLVLTACDRGSKSHSTTSSRGGGTDTTTTVAVPVRSVRVAVPYAVKDAHGKTSAGISSATVRVGPSPDGKFRVAFSEHAVGDTRAGWESAAWSAVTTASLMVGAPIANREIDFEIDGRSDGTSAGALLTVAVLSLLRGEAMSDSLTMTGSIDPAGGIGPVAGVAYKVNAAGAADRMHVLIPIGQRKNRTDTGAIVDSVTDGEHRGITVTEVSTVADAYRAFTGTDLTTATGANATAADDVDVDGATAARLDAKYQTWTNRFLASVGEFDHLPAEVRNDVSPIADEGNAAHQQAGSLASSGKHAGAFARAVEAAAFAAAAVEIGESYGQLLTNGPSSFASSVKERTSTPNQLEHLATELDGYRPATVSETGALVAAYEIAVDAVSLHQIATQLLDAPASNPTQATNQVTQGAVYETLAATIVDEASDLLDVARGLSGTKSSATVDPDRVADDFQHAANANLDAFDAEVVAPAAAVDKVSVDVEKQRFASRDVSYALALAGRSIVANPAASLGAAAKRPEARVGAAMKLYNRTASLLAKYSSFGEIDPSSLAVTGISNDQAFNAATALAQQQLVGVVVDLRDKSVNPTIAVADNEIAGIDREGTASDKLDALNEYWDGYLSGRVLAYIGGFAKS